MQVLMLRYKLYDYKGHKDNQFDNKKNIGFDS